MYHDLFKREEPRYIASLDEKSMTRAIATSNLIGSIRETFVLFLKLVRDRLDIPEARWSESMTRMFSLLEQDAPSLDLLHRHEYLAQSHLHGVHTDPFISVPLPKFGPLSEWEHVPHLVRIILVVPRENLALLEKAVEQFEIPTPHLQCEIRGGWSHNVYTSVHPAFGRIIQAGTSARPRVIFQNDPNERNGTSPLIVSFVVATRVLTIEPAEKIRVCFSIRSTASVSLKLTNKLGSEFCLFSANLMDSDHVHVLPEEPFPTSRTGSPSEPPSHFAQSKDRLADIGEVGNVAVEMDVEFELVSRLSCRVSIDNLEARRLFSEARVTPGISQISSCAMKLSIGKHTKVVVFPVPIIGGQNKLGLARKSQYIEVSAVFTLSEWEV
jgi:hypothetical protein